MNSMIGHNSLLGMASGQLGHAVVEYGDMVNSMRLSGAKDREVMAKAAERLLVVDFRAGGDEVEAERAIKALGVHVPTDRFADPGERFYARWTARGGQNQILPNDINELAPTRSGLLIRFLNDKKFAKANSFQVFFNAVVRECKSKIRDAVDEKEGVPSLDAIREAYADILFKADTVEEWIKKEQHKRTDEYKEELLRDKAWKAKKERARFDSNVLAGLLDFLDHEIKELRDLEKQQEAEAEAKASMPKLSASEQRDLAEHHRRAREKPSGGGEEFDPDRDVL